MNTMKICKSYNLSGLERCFLLFCFFIYISWCITFLVGFPQYGPDEGMRYDIPEFIYLNGKLPYGWEESIRDPNYGFSYGFNISLPYLTSAFFMWMMSFFSTSSSALLFAARLTSVLSSVGSVYYTILISKKLQISGISRWIFIILMSLTPQIIFLSSYVNLDSFSLFTALIIIYAWFCALEDSWSRRSCIRLAIGIGLCFLSYEYAYSFILTSFLLYCIWYLLNRGTQTFKHFFSTGIYILLIVFLICGWKFIRNAILFDGDIFALHASTPYAEQYAIDSLKPSARQSYTFRHKGLSILDLLLDTPWLETTFVSMFSVIGHMEHVLPFGYYVFWFFIFVVGLLGVLLLLLRMKLSHKSISTNHLLLAGALLLSAFITLGISIYFSWAVDYQSQGRYIITVLPMAYIMVALGADKWSKCLRITQKKFLAAIPLIIVSTFISISLFMTYRNGLLIYVLNQ